MKLKIEEFEKLSQEKGYRTGQEFLVALGGGQSLYSSLKNGASIGYEIVKNIYNYLGEYRTQQLVDFEKENINEFKAKYIVLAGKLY